MYFNTVSPYQWTRTFPPLLRAVWIKSMHSAKYWVRSWSGVSLACIHLYSISYIKWLMFQIQLLYSTIDQHFFTSDTDRKLWRWSILYWNLNKRPMGHIAHMRDQYILNTFAKSYDHIITLIWRRKKRSSLLWSVNGPYLLNLESLSPKDALCQVWLQLAQWFWRKRFLISSMYLCHFVIVSP